MIYWDWSNDDLSASKCKTEKMQTEVGMVVTNSTEKIGWIEITTVREHPSYIILAAKMKNNGLANR